LDVCEEVGEKASKEFVIETNLKAMMAQWEDISFKMIPFKTSSIVSGFEDIINVLD
jgi:dynein heavy chain